LIRLLRLLGQARNAEVEHLDPARFSDKNVIWLEITVHHALAVSVGQAFGKLANQIGSVKRLAGALLQAIQSRERLSGQQFHGHKDPIAIPIEVEHRDHIGVRQLLGLSCLALQRHQGIRVLAECRTQKLDRNATVRVIGLGPPQVNRGEHRAHTTRAQLLQ